MNTNLFYFKQLNVIGGIETFFYNLVRKYGKDYDITILYREADTSRRTLRGFSGANGL